MSALQSARSRRQEAPPLTMIKQEKSCLSTWRTHINAAFISTTITTARWMIWHFRSYRAISTRARRNSRGRKRTLSRSEPEHISTNPTITWSICDWIQIRTILEREPKTRFMWISFRIVICPRIWWKSKLLPAIWTALQAENPSCQTKIIKCIMWFPINWNCWSIIPAAEFAGIKQSDRPSRRALTVKKFSQTPIWRTVYWPIPFGIRITWAFEMTEALIPMIMNKRRKSCRPRATSTAITTDNWKNTECRILK